MTENRQAFTDVLILGAGFSGIAAGAKIAKQGTLSYRVLEKSDGAGGTWRDNNYPGCACDIPSPLYSLSFRQNPDWKDLFASQPEILDYLTDASDALRVTEHTVYNTEVKSADWREDLQQWSVSTEDGVEYRSRFLVSAMGILHHPSTPRLPGVESFQGPVFHSATWDHSVDLRGKRVAVVGTGASAIQFVPAIVDEVAALSLFQRTPPWIVPKANRSFSAEERAKLARNPLSVWKRRADLFWIHEKRAKGFVSDPSAMAPTQELASAHLARQVKDPTLRAKLTPDYAVGCKRLLISSNYYPALTKPHVDVVTAGVQEVRANSIVDADGVEHAADVIIFGTGFDAQNGLTRVPVRGRNGVGLGDDWDAGPEAYLGTTITGFPNMFVLCGPNTGLGHNSQIFMIEAQVNYMIRCLRLAGRAGVVEVRKDAQARFNGWLHGKLAASVWQSGGCQSWYQDPVSGRNTLLWPRSTLSFWLRTRRVRRSDYENTTSAIASATPARSAH